MKVSKDDLSGVFKKELMHSNRVLYLFRYWWSEISNKKIGSHQISVGLIVGWLVGWFIYWF